jgi:hypothetical protein
VRYGGAGLRCYAMPQGIEVRQGMVLPESGLSAQAFLLGAGFVIEWNGLNDAGQPVDPGAYQMQVTVRDPFGKTSSFAGAAQVLRSATTYAIAVYNSSGERVKTLLPLGSQKAVSNFSLSTDVFSPDSGMPCLQVVSGATLLACWDGSNEAGSPMESGNYVVVVSDSSGRMLVEKQVAVIRAPSAGEFKLLAAPNPLRGGEQLRLRVEGSGQGSSVEIELFSLAGERVWNSSLAGENGSIRISAPLAGLAPGTYVFSAARRGPSGLKRASLKIGVIR